MKASIDLLTAAAAREYELAADALTDGNEEESSERLTKANGFAKAAKVLEQVGPACGMALVILRREEAAWHAAIEEYRVDSGDEAAVCEDVAEAKAEVFAAIRALEEVSQ